MFGVAWSVCVSVLNCAKTAEPFEMPLCRPIINYSDYAALQCGCSVPAAEYLYSSAAGAAHLANAVDESIHRREDGDAAVFYRLLTEIPITAARPLILRLALVGFLHQRQAEKYQKLQKKSSHDIPGQFSLGTLSKIVRSLKGLWSDTEVVLRMPQCTRLTFLPAICL